MKITRFVVAAALLLVGSVAFARQSKSDETLEFRPHWSIGVQAGAAYTLGEAKFGKMISPSAALNFQWRFHHAMGLRLGVSGWQAKGSIVVPEVVYPYNYAQLNADYVLDLTALFGGYNHERLCNAYVFAGIGGAYGFNNKHASNISDILTHYWQSKFFVAGRAGLGVDFRLSKVVSLGLEGNMNLYSDKFNSKHAGSPDLHFNLLAGLKFNLGKTTKKASGSCCSGKTSAQQAAVTTAAATAAVAAASAQQVEVESVAAANAGNSDNEKISKAVQPAAVNETVEKTAEQKAVAAANSKDIFYLIGSAAIRSSENAKLVDLAKWMKANPDFEVAVVGYSDKETGSAERNMEISKMRAEAVKARLESLGVAGNRITVDYKGANVQPYSGAHRNRVAICTLK